VKGLTKTQPVFSNSSGIFSRCRRRMSARFESRGNHFSEPSVFDCLYCAVAPRPLKFDSQIFPVEVLPTQPKRFSCSKPERCVHHRHRPSIFIETLPETLKFLSRQSARLPYTSCKSFELQQAHGLRLHSIRSQRIAHSNRICSTLRTWPLLLGARLKPLIHNSTARGLTFEIGTASQRRLM